MAASVPEHKVLEAPNLRTILVSGWRISAATNPISNAQQSDALHAELGVPLPEMTFGNNSLTLLHEKSGFKYSFDAREALRYVKRGELSLEDGDGPVKVEYADAWLKSRTDASSMLPMPKTVPTKPYDWTYTTMYGGHIDTSPSPESTFHEPEAEAITGTSGPVSKFSEQSWVPAISDAPAHCIPMSTLTRPDPILFYAEIPLFEDELHDNGSSALLVRIRVMPTCIFILSRFTLRVDNVLFRTFDARIFHSLDSKVIIRELTGWEAPYSDVKNFLPKRNDLTPLTDPNFIAKIMSETLPSSKTQNAEGGAGTKWKGMGKRHEVLTFR